MLSNPCTRGQMFGLPFSVTYSRQAIIRILTSSSNNSELGVSVYRIHSCQLMSLFVFILLIDAVPVNPKISITESLRHNDGVLDCIWESCGEPLWIFRLFQNVPQT